MSNILVLMSLFLFLTACDKARMTSNEPSPEELAVELQNVPLAKDGKEDSSEVIPQNLVNSESNAAGIQSFNNISGDFVDGRSCIVNVTADLSGAGYEIVIVVNKARDKQTFHVYHKGILKHSWLTSTGVETPQVNKRGEISNRVTPTGFFTPIMGRLHEDYTSGSWNAPMPHTIFISHDGVAMHATSEKNYKYLGQRASAGCLRLRADNAKELFNFVKNEVGIGQVAKINNQGCFLKDSKGNFVSDRGYKTLVVIHDDSLVLSSTN